MNKSKFGKLSFKDLARGFVMMTGTTFFGLCGNAVTSGVFPDFAGFLNMGKLGLLAGAVYLGKNFFTNSKDEFLKTEKDGQGDIG